ncbi:MAG: replication-associated recombination protein A [Mycoplasma sp.]
MGGRVELNQLFKPKKIEDIIGQTHLLSDGSFIKKMIEFQKAYSIIFYGSPGIGKTSLAISLANDLNMPYHIFNAANDSKQKLVEFIESSTNNTKNIIIIEEIHRLNKDKQDILLPCVESGAIILFSTTTENPYFKVNPALRSRCQILKLEQITASEMQIWINKIILKLPKKLNMSENEIKIISQLSNGDLRSAINVIDILYNLYIDEKITQEIILSIMNQPILLGSHYGDELHDLKSAFHKSLRGSDVDASLHYLARLISINAIDDISRRMLAIAYEDVGLANPNLASRVSSGIETCYRLGLPESRIIFGSLCIQIACSPKSNTAISAIDSALKDVSEGKCYPIPHHIRDSHYASSKKLGVTGYKYPHDFPGAYVEQQYMPTKLLNTKYYIPKLENEFESKLNTWLMKLKNGI